MRGIVARWRKLRGIGALKSIHRYRPEFMTASEITAFWDNRPIDWAAVDARAAVGERPAKVAA